MKNKALLFWSIFFIVVGIAGIIILGIIFTFSGTTSPKLKTPFGGFSSQGEQIYFTGVGSEGSIQLRGGPMWISMHGGGCASCHGEDGQGGIPIMMSVEEAPAITYKALTEEEHDEHNGESEEEEEHPPYDDDSIKEAITEGIEPDGHALSWVMPRWKMSDEDFEDLLEFLESLD